MIKDIISKNEAKNPNEDKINKLKQIIPNCFDKNGRLDIELLKNEFNQDVDLTRESYELNFLGKSYAKMITGLDTETVIEPDIEHNNKSENKNSENIYISGDNLDGLKHLLKAYEGKVKCIYIDPPYNTGSDGFVYNDNFCFTKENLIEKLDISEDEAERIINMTSGNSSSHSAWLTFMYPRLYLARQLLTDDGVIFISIDDNEQSQLKVLCDDIFGEENFQAQIITVSNPGGRDYKQIAMMHEYILVYSKSNLTELNELDKNINYKQNDENGGYELRELRNRNPKFNSANRPNLFYPIYVNPNIKDKYGCCLVSDEYSEKFYIEVKPYNSLGEESVWRWGNKKLHKNIDIENIELSQVVAKEKKQGGWNIYEKCRKGTSKAKSLWNETEMRTEDGTRLFNSLFDNSYFDHPKPIELVKKCINIGTNDEDIILDFFSGSATTAHAVMDLNLNRCSKLKYIMIQLPEKIDKNKKAYQNGYKTIDEIGQERIKRAAKKIKEETNADIDYGFKHYTLKETDENLLNKLEQFEPQLINETYDLYKEYGIDTIVETWKLRDGYEFTTPVEVINCDGYNVYKCEESLYLIEPNININNIKSLLEHYNNDELFVCNKLVLFGYSFKFNEFEMIKNNIKQVKNFKNIDVKVYTRY